VKQRGRKSAASFQVNVSAEPPRLIPPTGLSRVERALFLQLAHSVNPDHFRGSDTELLASYVQSALLARQLARKAARNSDLISEWERSVRAQASLATRLRLKRGPRLSHEWIETEEAWPHGIARSGDGNTRADDSDKSSLQ